MNTINNQDAVNENRLTLKKKILINNPYCGSVLSFTGLKNALDAIVEDLERVASSKTFNSFNHNHPLIMLIEEVCYNLITDVVPPEGTASLEFMYKRCFDRVGRRVDKIYLDDELQKNHTVLPINEIIDLRDSVIREHAMQITITNRHKHLFIYLYLVRQKLLVTNND